MPGRARRSNLSLRHLSGQRAAAASASATSPPARLHLTAFSGKDCAGADHQRAGPLLPRVRPSLERRRLQSRGAAGRALPPAAFLPCANTAADDGASALAQAGEEHPRPVRRGGAGAALHAGEPAAAMRRWAGCSAICYETQKTDLSHIRTLEYYAAGRFMELDLHRPAEPGADGDPAAPRKRRAAFCGCWTRPRPPWAAGCSAPGWNGPCCSVTAIAPALRTPWTSLVKDTVAPGGADGLLCGTSGTWSGSSAASSTAPPAAGIWPSLPRGHGAAARI